MITSHATLLLCYENMPMAPPSLLMPLLTWALFTSADTLLALLTASLIAAERENSE